MVTPWVPSVDNYHPLLVMELGRKEILTYCEIQFLAETKEPRRGAWKVRKDRLHPQVALQPETALGQHRCACQVVLVG